MVAEARADLVVGGARYGVESGAWLEIREGMWFFRVGVFMEWWWGFVEVVEIVPSAYVGHCIHQRQEEPGRQEIARGRCVMMMEAVMERDSV